MGSSFFFGILDFEAGAFPITLRTRGSGCVSVHDGAAFSYEV